MQNRTEKNYTIVCKDCGYETQNFNGWAFVDKCHTPNRPGMMHNWTVKNDQPRS